jgi:GTP-binding protein
MAKIPIVAIIGRPNVGKSTLFNRMAGRRTAIVSEIPGTTRDHITLRIDEEDLTYLLMDTGGLGGGSSDEDFEDDVQSQSILALAHADLILFVVNGKEELTASDYTVVDLLRKERRRHVPVFLVVAKCDDAEKHEEAMPRFYELGMADQVFPISAMHNTGIEELREGIIASLKKQHFEDKRGNEGPKKVQEGPEKVDEPDFSIPRVAIVGRPNVGKSSLVNALMSDEQRKVSPRLTSPIPGTTRDSTETIIRREGKEIAFVDTAGLRKQSRVEEDLEAYAVLRAIQSIADADVTVLVLDCTQQISKQDKHIAGLAIEEGKGLILLGNKADLLDAEGRERVRAHIQSSFPFCRWAPLLLTSAETRENLPHLFGLITAVSENRRRRIATPLINRLFEEIVAGNQTATGGRLPFKYVTQVDTAPPTFALFLRDPRRLGVSTLRFLENRLREHYSFDGTPVRWLKKGGERSER